jgi:hypothetical protein
MKHLLSLGGAAIALGFVAVFFSGRIDNKPLAEVAPRVGMNAIDLQALAPRIAAQSGATIGTSRRIVYLLACSGLPSRATMEAQALRAATLAHERRISAREASLAVLDAVDSPGAAPLADC